MKKIYLALMVAMIGVSCGSGENAAEKPAFTTEDVQAKAGAVSGEDIYKRVCTSCHMAGGDGIANVYPPLAKSDYLADREKTILQVIKGSSGKIVVNGKEYNNTMPPQQLTDEEVAAVLTYVYTNTPMGNNGTAVTADEVKAVRAKQ